MPTHAVLDPESGKPLRLDVTPPYDMPIVTYHVREADGTVRDATLGDIDAAQTIVSEEHETAPHAPIFSREHHTHSPLHRRYWPLDNHPSYQPHEPTIVSPDADSLEVPGLSQSDPGAGENAPADPAAVSPVRSAGTETESPTE